MTVEGEGAGEAPARRRTTCSCGRSQPGGGDPSGCAFDDEQPGAVRPRPGLERRHDRGRPGRRRGLDGRAGDATCWRWRPSSRATPTTSRRRSTAGSRWPGSSDDGVVRDRLRRAGRSASSWWCRSTQLSTAQARAALPEQVPHADAVHTAARAALLVAALGSGDTELLRDALDDRLHEPYRAPLVPLLGGGAGARARRRRRSTARRSRAPGRPCSCGACRARRRAWPERCAGLGGATARVVAAAEPGRLDRLIRRRPAPSSSSGDSAR